MSLAMQKKLDSYFELLKVLDSQLLDVNLEQISNVSSRAH